MATEAIKWNSLFARCKKLTRKIKKNRNIKPTKIRSSETVKTREIKELFGKSYFTTK